MKVFEPSVSASFANIIKLSAYAYSEVENIRETARKDSNTPEFKIQDKFYVY